MTVNRCGLKKRSPERYFFTVNVLRAPAAFAVIIWHYQQFYSTSAGALFLQNRAVQPFYQQLSLFYDEGYKAVQIFWAISGFVLTSIYANEDNTTRQAFIGARLARLYPLHLLTLLVVLAFQTMSFALTNHYQLYPINDPYHFILNLLFASHWGLQRGYSFNAPIWSVSVEALIYLAFMLLMRPLKSNDWLAPVLAALFFLLSRLPGPLSVIGKCGVFFFIGSAAFYVWRRMRETSFRFVLAAGVILSISTWLAPKAAAVWAAGAAENLQLYLFCFSILLISATLDRVRFLSRAFAYAGILGDLTYGVYLWQVPLQIAIMIGMEVYAVDREIVSREGFFIGYLSLVFVTAYASHRLFEEPARRLIRSLCQ